jgi:hypothetical protein
VFGVRERKSGRGLERWPIGFFRYSTVTLFARFLGLSIDRPSATAA